MAIAAPGLALSLAAALAAARAPEPRATAVAAEPVAVWVTTADEKSLLERRPDVSFARLDDRAGETVIDVDEATVYQEVDGFGASLTESAASVLANGLSEPARDEVMRRLFSRDGGIGLSLLRQPMSASDFALGNYTYDDRPPGDPDPDLRSFSIDRDRPLLLPLLKRALELNPRLRFMATPWSAPAWMKYYALGHLSAFVVPGARRIESTSVKGLLETVAFRNPDGSKVLLALNASETERPFQLRHAGRAFPYALPPGAVATFRWP